MQVCLSWCCPLTRAGWDSRGPEHPQRARSPRPRGVHTSNCTAQLPIGQVLTKGFWTGNALHLCPHTRPDNPAIGLLSHNQLPTETRLAWGWGGHTKKLEQKPSFLLPLLHPTHTSHPRGPLTRQPPKGSTAPCTASRTPVVVLPVTLCGDTLDPLSRSLSPAEPVDGRDFSFSKMSCLSLYPSSAHLGLGVNE